jgi:uncharacterized membrane protein
MGKRAKAKRDVGKTAPPVKRGPELRTEPNWPLLALSGVGIVLAGYLSWTSFSGLSVRGCTVGSACDIVLTSQWAKLFGLPTAFWGLLTYATLAGSAFIRRVDRQWYAAWCVSLLGALYSAYLTTVSLTILDAACPYCLTSFALMTAIFALTTYQRPAALRGFSWKGMLTKTIPVAAVIILALHLYYAGLLGKPPEGEDPKLRALAEHLTQTGAKFYGASWCPHCIQQKEYFGSSAKRLPYIECSPGGQRAPQSQVCRDAKIESYPTWIINGQRLEDVLTVQRLADSSGFQLNTP